MGSGEGPGWRESVTWGSARRASVPAGPGGWRLRQKRISRSLRRVPDGGRHSGSSRIVLPSRGGRTRRPRRTARVALVCRRARGSQKAARDGSVRGTAFFVERGKTTPACPDDGPPKRLSDVVNHPESPVRVPLGPQSRVGPPSSASWSASRERARYGYTFSFGWHLSVGRIARSHRREDARPHGAARSLARRTLEASSDTGHGPRDGETVRV
jgi:hypothetical protein